MPADVKILADSLNPERIRLTTFEVTMHRYIWPEFMTHRVFSRNAQSNRAIPTARLIEMVRQDPAIPNHWGINQRGMQADREHDQSQQKVFHDWWVGMSRAAADNAEDLAALGLHKQVVNRVLEPYQWIKGIVTATAWDNFFELRCHLAAQPEIRWIAERMRSLMEESAPSCLHWGDWHLPLIDLDVDVELSMEERVRVCVARCARVSYLTHDGKRDRGRDLELHDQLLRDGHMSPFEHAAQACSSWYGSDSNFDSTWVQYRKMIERDGELSAS